MEFFIALFGCIWLFSALSREQNTKLKYKKEKDRDQASKDDWERMIVNEEREYELSGLFDSFVENGYAQGKFAEDLKEIYLGSPPPSYYRIGIHRLMYKYLYYSEHGMLPKLSPMFVNTKDNLDVLLRGYAMIEKRLREHGIPAYFIVLGYNKPEGDITIKPIQNCDEYSLRVNGYYRLWGPKALIMQDGNGARNKIAQLIREEEIMENESR